MAAYQAALQSVTFSTAASTPSGTRTVSFQVDDGQAVNHASNVASRDITVTHQAPVVTTTAGETSFSQVGPPVTVDNGLTVTSPSGGNLDSGEVEVTAGFEPGDTLGFTNVGAITGSYDSADGVLTLTGTASAGDYQAFLRSVTYSSGTTANPGTSRTVGFMVSDSVASSGLATRDVTITLHSAPVLANIEGSALDYATGSGPAAVTSSLTVTAPDDTVLAIATVSISAGYLEGQDTLAFTNTATITGNFDATSGVLTLSGPGTVAAYQAALQSVTFSTAASSPSGTRTVSFQVDDGQAVNHASNVVSRPITVTHQAPVVTTTAGSTAYTQDDPPVAVDPGVAVASPSGVDLVSGEVELTAGFEPGDVLGFTNTGALTGSYDSTTGVLTVSGTGTAAQYQAFFRSVTYTSGTNASPGTSRTVGFMVSDSVASSGLATKDVTITLHSAPVLANIEGAALDYATGSGPAAVTSSLTVTAPDDTDLASATVSISAGYLEGQDTLAFTNTATITGSFDATSGVLTLSGPGTVADYQAALQSVTFSTAASSPSGTRTVSFQVDDGQAVNHASNVVSRAITVTHQAPVVTTTAGGTAYTQDDPPVAVDPGVAVASPSGVDLVSGEVEVTAGFEPGDVLGFTNMGTLTGSYDSTDGVLTVSGTGTAAQYQAFLRSVTYTSGTNASPGASRTVGFMASDSVASSGLATKDVSITLHSAPVLANIEGTALAYATGSGPAAVTSSLTVTAPDDTDLASATVSISAGYLEGQDTLSFTNTTTITGSFDATTGVLTLSGPGTVADYQAALRSVTFSATGSTPSGSRTVSFQVDDGQAVNHASNVVNRAITVTHVDAAPVPQDQSASSLGNVGITVPAPGVATGATEPDGDSIVAKAVVGGTSAHGGTFDIAASGGYDYTPAPGYTGADSFQFQLCDGNDTSLCATATVNVTVSGEIWFVDASAPAGGNGQLASPFNCLTGAGCLSAVNDGAAAHPKAGDSIFLYSGSYTGGVTLLGQPEADRPRRHFVLSLPSPG